MHDGELMKSVSVALAALALSTTAFVTPPVNAASQVRAPVPEIEWKSCDLVMECGTAEVPLDYDDPDGETITLAMRRIPASDPDRRVGSLFMNYGGPGEPGSTGINLPVTASTFGPDVRAKFDIVAVDPRGVGASSPVTCAPAAGTDPVERPTSLEPTTPEEVDAHLASNAYIRKSCDENAGPILDHMSTADTARDLDLVRQALGDERLTYYGMSYGSLLGQTYAAMFPDRIRAAVVDGVLDPVAATTGSDGDERPHSARLGQAAAIESAIETALARCDRAGILRCPLAGNAFTRWQRVADSLAKAPLQVGPVALDGQTFKFALTVSALQLDHLSGVPLPSIELLAGATKIVDVLRFGLSEPASASTNVRISGQKAINLAAPRSVLLDRLAGILDRLQSAAPQEDPAPEDVAAGMGDFWGISCSDAVDPDDPRAWVGAADESRKTAPHFGASVTWTSSVCAQWPGSDEDAYRGPFETTTSTPLMIIGNTHDNATPISGADAAHELFTGSRQLTLNAWGHTALGKSRTCVQPKVDAYLLDRTLPTDGQVCAPDHGLFGLTP